MVQFFKYSKLANLKNETGSRLLAPVEGMTFFEKEFKIKYLIIRLLGFC
ncbi:hypothetical protein SAMN05444274_103457 [Mariniphaga anaerophila]|uniref:Uncharacterized protein n=1 Tax=Mariniphaga anaerophila TaxID=1484053 RepID=A0A1M4YU31_9BACT|nr:hypothetical protein SAMN05444274_103457 [Mariniphaga anaerophila]